MSWTLVRGKHFGNRFPLRSSLQKLFDLFVFVFLAAGSARGTDARLLDEQKNPPKVFRRIFSH